jgi:hypothetical protein
MIANNTTVLTKEYLKTIKKINFRPNSKLKLIDVDDEVTEVSEEHINQVISEFKAYDLFLNLSDSQKVKVMIGGYNSIDYKDDEVLKRVIKSNTFFGNLEGDGLENIAEVFFKGLKVEDGKVINSNYQEVNQLLTNEYKDLLFNTPVTFKKELYRQTKENQEMATQLVKTLNESQILTLEEGLSLPQVLERLSELIENDIMSVYTLRAFIKTLGTEESVKKVNVVENIIEMTLLGNNIANGEYVINDD